MRIAVIGVGAVGGYFGGRLAEAGEDVTFVARGATLEALEAKGLIVESINGDFTINPARTTSDPAIVGPVDLVLFGVKAWQLAEAARSGLPMFGPDTVALPLQNGVEGPEALAGVVGRHRVLGGLCKIFVQVAEPGHIRHLGVEPSIDFGELDGHVSPRAEAIRAAFEAAGVRIRIAEHIEAAMWEKFLFIVATSAVGAVTRATLGELREVPESRAVLEESMREIWRLARARDVPVTDGIVDRVMAFVDGLPEEATASMQRDIMAGRPSELEAQSGAVVRLAAEVGFDVPVNSVLYGALLPAELKARGAA